MKANPELFRYVRPTEIDLTRLEIITKPTSGIAFLFTINQDNSTLDFIPVICRDDENFNYDLCRKIAYGRKEKNGAFINVPYDRSLSLVDNVVEYLNSADNWLEFVQSLKTKLNSIIKTNNRVSNEFDNLIESLSKNRHKFMGF